MPKWTLLFLFLSLCASVCTHSFDGDGAFVARVVSGVGLAIAMMTFVIGREDARRAMKVRG